VSARGLAAALVLLFAGAAAAAEPELRIEPLASPVKVRLRGLSAFSDSIAWASGREGTVLRSIDGGAHWDVFKVPGAETLDFRDVQAFGPDVALVMGAGPGDASRVYRTGDGGRTWTLALRNPDAEGFFDCMDFDGDEGRLLGDPVKGRFQIFASSDGGRSWRSTKGPKAMKDEAAFAASGTCLRRIPGGTIVVTGGSAARVHLLPDRFIAKQDWKALDSGVKASATSGLFSVALRSGAGAIAVGGDYKLEKEAGGIFGFEVDAKRERSQIAYRLGEEHYTRVENDMKLARRVKSPLPWDHVLFERYSFFTGELSGYRSAIECTAEFNPLCIATGPAGTDLLPPAIMKPTPLAPVPDTDSSSLGFRANPSEWRRVSEAGYDNISMGGRVAWFSGDEGRLGRMQLPAPRQ
jgi:photosystem II stability/assembly factor-like uncharacterized protein